MKENSNNMQSKMWDERYSNQEFAYGKLPNVFFEESIQKLKPGKILMPADGEGRNGVYAAKLGWNVTAIDLSLEGKQKALALAKENNVTINYLVNDLIQLDFEKESFDAIGLIYAHFSAENKSLLHKKLDKYLKPGGLIIFEAFSKAHLQFNQLNPKVGGPKDIDTLFSIQEIAADFSNYEFIVLAENEVDLAEGKYHIGKGSVIRFIGRKK